MVVWLIVVLVRCPMIQQSSAEKTKMPNSKPKWFKYIYIECTLRLLTHVLFTESDDIRAIQIRDYCRKSPSRMQLPPSTPTSMISWMNPIKLKLVQQDQHWETTKIWCREGVPSSRGKLPYKFHIFYIHSLFIPRVSAFMVVNCSQLSIHYICSIDSSSKRWKRTATMRSTRSSSMTTTFCHCSMVKLCVLRHPTHCRAPMNLAMIIQLHCMHMPMKRSIAQRYRDETSRYANSLIIYRKPAISGTHTFLFLIRLNYSLCATPINLNLIVEYCFSADFSSRLFAKKLMGLSMKKSSMIWIFCRYSKAS